MERPIKVSAAPQEDPIVGIFKALRESIDASRPTCKEIDFKQVFVPMFANAPDRDKRVTFNTWLALAGGSHSEVDVVDSRGAVLFTVPPLFANGAVSIFSGEAGKRLSHVLTHAHKLEQIMPGKGQRYADEHLQQFEISNDRAPSIIEGYATRWHAIFYRYGYAATSPDSGPGVSTERSSGNEYDALEF